LNGIGLTHDRRQNLVCAALLGIAYILCYGWLLWSSDFLPYAMDNNESFSSLVHAFNLTHFDLSRSFGLTDEAVAFDPVAHPYLYTHQGNFPRVFASLIYVLGARSVEAQILVTTFTIGLAALIFAYQYLNKISNPLFGFIACLLMITDYLLVAQWQVVTYRVWYEFFVFATILCMHGIGTGRLIWKIATVLTFACLYYFELVFAAFVSVACVLYAGTLYWRIRVVLFRAWGLIGAGSVIGLGTLSGQLVLYMGWNDFLTDVQFTFLARNHFRNDAAVLQNMKEFFDSRNIAFWFNLEDGSRFRSIKDFVNSLTYYDFQVHTPFFTILCVLLVFGLLFGYLWNEGTAPKRTIDGNSKKGRRNFGIIGSFPVWAACGLSILHFLNSYVRDEFGAWQVFAVIAILATVLTAEFLDRRMVLFRDRMEKRDRSRQQRTTRVTGLAVLACIFPSLLFQASFVPGLFANYMAVFSATFLVYFLLYASLVLYLLVMPGPHTIKQYFLLTLQAFALFVFFVVIIDKSISFGIRGDTARFLPAPVQLWIAAAVALFATGARLVVQLIQHRGEIGNIIREFSRLSIFILIVALMLGSHYRLYDRLYEPVWNEVLQAALPRPLQYLMLLLTVAIAFTMAAKRLNRPFADWIDRSPFHLMAFVCTGLAAYIVVYILSPGYIFSGYRSRLAPFTAFHTTMVAAFALYIVASLALQCFRISRPSEGGVGSGGIPGRQSVEIRCKSLVGFGCIALLTLMFWYWGTMQAVYLRLLPPDNFSFLKKLSQPPYAGASFIVNQYAAPIAAATGNWAYLHAGAVEEKLVERNGRLEIVKDPDYLWFADKRTNVTYDHPEYFICISTPSLWSMAETLRYAGGRGEGYPGCGKHRFVRLARGQDKANVYPSLTLVEADQEGTTNVGFERWAIVKLTW